jgi:hypothetical protein
MDRQLTCAVLRRSRRVPLDFLLQHARMVYTPAMHNSSRRQGANRLAVLHLRRRRYIRFVHHGSPNPLDLEPPDATDAKVRRRRTLLHRPRPHCCSDPSRRPSWRESAILVHAVIIVACALGRHRMHHCRLLSHVRHSDPEPHHAGLEL